MEHPTYVTPAGLAHVEFHAMGTTVALLLPEADADRGAELVRGLFEEWELTLSRFLPGSELSRLNASAGRTVKVGALLFSVLKTALEAAEATGGLYDPTLLGQIIAVGYASSFDTLPAQQPAFGTGARPRPGGDWRRIVLDPETREAALPTGAGVDFGGIGKGMAVDAAIERLRDAGLSCGLVNAGGDLSVFGLPPGVDAWPVAVPGRVRDDWSVIALARGSMATSGIARRQWRQGVQLRHHLLDPRTGMPATSALWSVTVVAQGCAQAEVAAKVAFVLGPEEGPRFLERLGMVGHLVLADGTRAMVGPWPDETPVARGVGEQRDDLHTVPR